jgi:hypothetical protein
MLSSKLVVGQPAARRESATGKTVVCTWVGEIAMARKAMPGNMVASPTMAAVGSKASSSKVVPAKPMMCEMITASMTAESVTVEAASSVASPVAVTSSSVAVTPSSVASSSMASASGKCWRIGQTAQCAEHKAYY